MTMQDDIIKSISYDQEEIIRWIMELYVPDGFDLDPTYSKGNFYKNIQEPRIKSDISPQVEGVHAWDCRAIPLPDAHVSSIMFDPPFVAAMPKAEPTGKITQRFGYYPNIQTAMWTFYGESMREFYRLLKDNGILVVKCQDVIDSGKQYLSHVEIVNSALAVGFYPKDLFVLLAKHRIIGKYHRKQQHARKYHSYFLVFIKKKNPVIYSHVYPYP